MFLIILALRLLCFPWCLVPIFCFVLHMSTCSSEYQELEAVPTPALVDGPLERGGHASATHSEIPDEPLERFFVSL